VTPVLTVLCGREPTGARETASRFGIPEVASDWRTVISRDDIDIIDICTPGDTHAEIALAALKAGKHVLCEKPLGLSPQEWCTSR